MEDPSIFFERCYNSLESTKQEPTAERQREGWMKAFQDELMQIYLSGLQEPLRCRVEEQADLDTPEKLVEAACNIFNATKPRKTSAFVSATDAQPKESSSELTTSKQQELIESVISMIGYRNNGPNRNGFRGRGRSNFRGGQNRGGQFRNRWNNRNQSQQGNPRTEIIRNPNVVCYECHARGHPRRLCPRRTGGGPRKGVAAIEHKPDTPPTTNVYTGVVPQTFTPPTQPALPIMYDQPMYATPSPLPPQPMIPAYVTPTICSIGAIDENEADRNDSNGIEAIKIQKRPFFKVSTDEGDFNFLVDTGACTSCVNSNVYRALHNIQMASEAEPERTNIAAASGEPMTSLGTCEIKIMIDSDEVKHKFVIIKNLANDGILGADFISDHNVIIEGTDGHIAARIQGKSQLCAVAYDIATVHPKRHVTLSPNSITPVEVTINGLDTEPPTKTVHRFGTAGPKYPDLRRYPPAR